jgi:RimJ/RimL family protein N-acetyltransferase
MNDAAAARPLAQRRWQFSYGGATLTEFEPADVRTLFEIRNHETVRPFMPDPTPLQFERHEAWVAGHLGAGRPLRLFIARQQGQAVGFTIFKQVAAGVGEIGVLFKEPDRHTTLAAQTAAVMLWVCCAHFGMDWVLTFVNPGHERALAINRGFGLIEAASDKAGELCFRTPASVVLEHPRYRRIWSRLDRQFSAQLLAG